MSTARLPEESRIDLATAEPFRLGAIEVRPPFLQIAGGSVSQLLEPRVMQMLVALHHANGSPLSRDQLIDNCWGGLTVSDDAITQCVSKLRRALASVPDVRIESVPRVGYRLVVSYPDGISTTKGGHGFNRRMAIGSAIGVAAVAGLGGAFLLLKAEAGLPGDSIAVLPFANLSGDPAQSYFSDGIAEEVRNSLARIRGLKVVGRTSSEAVRNSDAETAASKLHVDTVLTGSVRRSASVIRVAIQLVDGRNGVERWSESYDLAPGDTLQLQTQVAESVAAALSLELGHADLRTLGQGGTRNPAALDLYLQAKHALLVSDTLSTVRQVIALCEAAIDLDAGYAAAHALKGMAWDAFAMAFAPNVTALQQAYLAAASAAQRAITIAPQMAEGYVALGRSMSGRLNLRGALSQYRRAEQFSHSDPSVLNPFVLTLSEIGRTTEGILLAEKLVALDPLNAAAFGMRGFAQFYARQFEAAAQSERTALQIAPGITQHRSLLGDCLCLLGRFDEARGQYAQVPQDDIFRLTGEAIVAARMGDRKKSDINLDEIARLYGPAYYQFAQIRAQLGEIDQAFSALDRAWATLDAGLTALPTDPFIDPLRSDRRFQAVLGRLDVY